MNSSTKVIVGALTLLAIALVMMVSGSLNDPLRRGRLKLPVGKGIPAVGLSERHGLILASDGSLWSWGSDFLGWPVLGLGSSTHQTIRLRRIGNETNWISISAAEDHNLAIKQDGTLWTWGESVHDRFTRPTPIPTPIPAAPGNGWKQAAAGGIHSAALKKDGTLWAWGDNWAGSVGIASTNGSSVPVQIGSATNWIRVWAGLLETVAMQTDGSLWYWGENPDPRFAQGAGQVFTPMRISEDTNWVDVGFGVNTVFAIKSDGTLWAWGRQAHVHTGASEEAQDAIPTRVGTNSDWQTFASCAGWWCQGLTKKDGSLWFMDASDGKSNGPRAPYNPVKFRRIELQKDGVAYAAGAAHAAGNGLHGPIGVVLTRDGEVWTWGMILGDPPTLLSRLQRLMAGFGATLHLKIPTGDPEPTYRDQPWQLRNLDSESHR